MAEFLLLLVRERCAAVLTLVQEVTTDRISEAAKVAPCRAQRLTNLKFEF